MSAWGILGCCAVAATLASSAQGVCPDFRFASQPYPYSVGNGLVAIGAGDFDRDGRTDLVGTLSGANAVAVMLGGGDGTLGAPREFGAGAAPQALTVADFDADGGLDLAVANSTANTVSFLRGDGAGGFLAPIPWASPTLPIALATADFNHDGQLDLAVANRTSNDVTVILGAASALGGTTFTYPVQYGPTSLAVGDFNADGHADIATANGSAYSSGGAMTISVLLGTGSGTFGARADYSVMNPANVRAADLNADGRADLVVTTSAYSDAGPWMEYRAIVFLAAADGTFGTRVSTALSGSPTTFVVHDFTRDGRFDLALTYGTRVSILPGNGDGTFATAIDTPGRAVALGTGDFDGDGAADLAGAMDSSVALWMGNGNGTFRTTGAYAKSVALAVADFNGDGRTDVAAMEPYQEGRLFLLLGGGSGDFAVSHQAPSAWSSSSPFPVTADFNRDGRADLVVAGSSVNLYLGMADGSLGAATSIPAVTEGIAYSAATGDVNADGKIDLAVAGTYYIALMLGKGDGTFFPPVNLSACSSHLVAITDVTGDRKLDVVVDGKNCGTGVLRGNGDGTFATAVFGGSFGCSAEPSQLIPGDFNRDGRGDVVRSGPLQTDCTKTVAYVLLGNADGTFTPEPIRTYYVGLNPLVGDFDADGIVDLVLRNGAAIRNVSLLRGAGDGTFGTPADFESVSPLLRLAAGDFNGDMRPDLFGSQNGSTLPVVLLNSCTVPIAPDNLVATAVFYAPMSVLVTWRAVAGASRYEVFRRMGNAPFALLGTSVEASFSDRDAGMAMTHLYFVKTIDAANNASAASNVDLATTVDFFEESLLSGVTTIRSVHVSQLRTAVNAVREAAGLGPAAFTGAVGAGGTVRAVHLAELRSLIDGARIALGLPAGAYSGSAPSTGSQIRAADVSELRTAVK